jgi:hypothetical protein
MFTGSFSGIPSPTHKTDEVISMSMIRTTTTVDTVEIPTQAPQPTLAELLADIGVLKHQQHATLPCPAEKIKGGPPLSLAEANAVVHEAASTREALATLAADPTLTIPLPETTFSRARLERLAATDDKAGAVHLAKTLIRGRQERIQSSVLQLASEACQELGFTAKCIAGEDGIVLARSQDGKRTVSIEAAKTATGGVRLHFDADGFHGGSCAHALNALEERLRAKGVRFAVQSQRHKDRRPAFDGRRLAQAAQTQIRA